jgi:hypothetical protein
MTNERLHASLARSGLTVEVVADRAEVDPKTVRQWLRGRVPHPRHRWSVAALVGEDEEFLWPDAQRPISDGHASSAELVSTFPRRSNVESSRWRVLINGAKQQIDLLGYTLYFLPQQVPELVEVLAEKCEEGCRVRILMADPDCEQVRLRDEEEQEPITIVARIHTSLRAFEPLRSCSNAELHFQTAPLYNSVYRFDDEMFVTPHLYATPGHSAPLMHFRRLGPNGVFSRFAAHYEGLWSDSRPIGQDRTDQAAEAGV